MASQRKTLIWLLVIAVIAIVAAIIIYLFRCDIFKNLNSCVQDPNKNNTPVPPGSPTTKWVPEQFPLNLGMFGPKIKALQQALEFAEVDQDGKFGNIKTKPAVIAKGYSVPLSEADYNKIIGASTGTSPGPVGPPPVPPIAAVGQKVNANQITNIRSSPYVDDGWFDNKVCELPANYEPAPTILEIADCSKNAGKAPCYRKNNYFWYKISFQIANCSDKVGWVRQDVVTVK